MAGKAGTFEKHVDLPGLLDQLDVSQVDIGGHGGIDDLENGVDGDWRQQRRMLRDDF